MATVYENIAEQSGENRDRLDESLGEAYASVLRERAVIVRLVVDGKRGAVSLHPDAGRA